MTDASRIYAIVIMFLMLFWIAILSCELVMYYEKLASVQSQIILIEQGSTFKTQLINAQYQRIDKQNDIINLLISDENKRLNNW
jgi:hypothetical protein